MLLLEHRFNRLRTVSRREIVDPLRRRGATTLDFCETYLDGERLIGSQSARAPWRGICLVVHLMQDGWGRSLVEAERAMKEGEGGRRKKEKGGEKKENEKRKRPKGETKLPQHGRSG